MNGFLAPKQNAVGGGGEALGDATVWPTAATWAALASIAGPRDGDQAPVTDADGSGTTGVAQWSASDGEWQLLSADFATKLLRVRFPNPIAIGATCTAVGVAFDRRLIPAARTPDATDRAVWVPSEVPAVDLTLGAWSVGGESDATLTAQGYAITESGTGSVDASGGRTTVSGGSGFALLDGAAPTTTQGVYMMGVVRANTAGSVGRGIQYGDTANGARIYQVGSGAVRLYDSVGSTAVTTNVALQGSAIPFAALAADDGSVTEMLDLGTAVTMSLSVGDATNQMQARRNLVGGALQRAAWVALSATQIDLEETLVITWTVPT